MQRPAKRIQLNHTRSSLAPPSPSRPGGPTSGGVLRRRIWRQQDRMRRCGTDSGAIARSFRGEKARYRRIAAASINCDFRTLPARRNSPCPMPSPAIMSGSISRRPAAGHRSSSCTNSPPTTPIGSRRCAISRAATAASPIPPAAIRRPMCRRRRRPIATGISTPTHSPCSIISGSPRRIWSACRWDPIRRCRSLSTHPTARCR